MQLSTQARKSLALALVALVGAVVALSGSWRPSFFGEATVPSGASVRRVPPPPAGSAELALVAPLAPGSTFEGWTVRHVSGVHEGRIRIELERGSERAALSIHAAKGGPTPPATAGPYAVYYSARGAVDGEQLARALAKVLEQHAGQPVPAGLGEFREESRTR